MNINVTFYTLVSLCSNTFFLETVVYDEPGSILNTIPQTGLEMEQCPAYGVFNKR